MCGSIVMGFGWGVPSNPQHTLVRYARYFAMLLLSHLYVIPARAGI